MKALILNSGMGRRMGSLTDEHPKCMTVIDGWETILSRQLKLLEKSGVSKVVVTTGFFDKILIEYCNSLDLNLEYTFINNSEYEKTNYIYSIYLAREHLRDEILMMHGDLVFEESVLKDVINSDNSCVVISSLVPLPPKDFKAVIEDGMIRKVGIEFFDKAVASQPLYKLSIEDWKTWLNQIIEYCETGNVNCYAENALNQVSDNMHLKPLDVNNRLCAEIDTPEDLKHVTEELNKLKSDKEGNAYE